MEYLIIGLATALCSLRAFQSNRQFMLYCGLLQYGFFAAYWHMEGEYTAMYISAIGMLCIGLQSFIPHIAVRFGIAMVAAIWAFYISGHAWMDMMPLVAFSIGRLSEAMHCPNKIRMGYHMSAFSWMIFAIFTHDMAAIASSSVILTSLLVANLYHRGWLRGILMHPAFNRIKN